MNIKNLSGSFRSVFLFSLFLFLISTQSILAQTIVNSLGDNEGDCPEDCTLRGAISVTQGDPDPTVVFDDSLLD